MNRPFAQADGFIQEFIIGRQRDAVIGDVEIGKDMAPRVSGGDGESVPFVSTEDLHADLIKAQKSAEGRPGRNEKKNSGLA